MYDILIIGAGPAGISSGLYAKRAGNNVLILYHGTSNHYVLLLVLEKFQQF